MSQLRDMLKIYGLFIASIMTLMGAIFIGVGLSSGSADIAMTMMFIGGVMAFIGLAIIWGALKKPKPRPYGRYPYYPQYPGYPQYYPYQQYPVYPPYYQQPQYQQQQAQAAPSSGHPAQSPYPPQQSQTYPSTYPTPRPPPPYPSHRPYPPPSQQSHPAQAPPPSYQRYPTQPVYPPSQPPRQGYPPQQPYRQPTRPPPPQDYKEQKKSYQPVESQEPHRTDEEFPPPPDYTQISRDPYDEPQGEPRAGPENGEHVPVTKEVTKQGPKGVPHPQGQQPPPPPGQVPPPSTPHKIMVQTSPSAAPPPPPYGYQPQYPQAQSGYRQGYQPAYQPYPQYPYPYPQPQPPGYGAPQKEAKLELPNILTLFMIFVSAIFIGALGLYIGGPMILLFPIAFIIAFSFPSFMWISYVYKKDVHEPEPRRVVLIALTFGFLSTILAIILSLPFVLVFPSLVVSAVIVAPLVEEFCKASGLRLVKSEINAEIDGVIYGVTIGMGFAMVENFLYELGFLFEDPAVWTFGSLLRGLGSTIGHGLGAGMIGYAYASYHMNRDRPGAFNNVILAYIAAVGLHALWNGVAVLSGDNALGLVVIVLIAVAEVVILKTLVSIARDKELQRRTEGQANEPSPIDGRDNR